MINIIEKQSLTDRSSSKFDPISFYVWQIIISQTTLFISYIFRALRLIDISNNNQITLDQLPNYLKFTLKLPAEEMNNVVEKIIHKLEELLDFKISEANDLHEKARELKDIVIKEHEKFMNSQNNEFESFTKQKIQHNSSRNINSQNRIDNSTSISNNRFNNEKSFLQDLQYIENQERKLSFKEIVSKPTQPFYQKLSKTQTNILNKINKIASFQDLQFQKVQKIKQIESTILNNLETNYQKLYDSATKFKQLKNKSILKLVLKPIQVQKANPQQIKQASLSKLIQNKIFATQVQKSYLLKKDTTVNYLINKSGSQKKIEQNIKVNYLTYEKLEKIKFIQNFFRKYLSQKKQVNDQNMMITQIPQKKNHYFKIDVNKVRSRSSYTNASQTSRTKTSNLIKLNKQNLQNFLKRQESQGKQSYQDKLVQAKQKKIYQAIDMGDCNLINNSGFIFCKDDFNVRDQERNTPLYYSAKKNIFVISLYLLQKGANPNTKCLKGQTPTHMACLTQNPEMFNLFKSYGADFNMQDDNGITPQALYKNITSELKIQNEIPFTSPKFDEFLVF